jgi:hypothetical protein
MRYEKPEVISATSAFGLILGTKPFGSYAEGMIYHTTSAYEADE